MKFLKSIILSAALGATAALGACTEDSPKTVRPDGGDEPIPGVSARGSFAKGADVSWLTELEEAGYTFATPKAQTKNSWNCSATTAA